MNKLDRLLRDEKQKRFQSTLDLREALDAIVDAAVDGDLEAIEGYLEDAKAHKKRLRKHQRSISDLEGNDHNDYRERV